MVSVCAVAIITSSLGIPKRHIKVIKVCLAVWVWINSNSFFLFLVILLPICSTSFISLSSPAFSHTCLIVLFSLASFFLTILSSSVSKSIYLKPVSLYLSNISFTTGKRYNVASSVVFWTINEITSLPSSSFVIVYSPLNILGKSEIRCPNKHWQINKSLASTSLGLKSA